MRYLESIYSQELEQGKDVFFLYFGSLCYTRLSALLKCAQLRLREKQYPVTTQKKAYHIINESLENIIKHATLFETTHPTNNVLFYLMEDEGHLSINTANYVLPGEKIVLEQRMGELANQESKDGLRNMYLKSLTNQSFSERGTAGLGLLGSAIKADALPVVQFIPADNYYAYLIRFPIKI